MCENFGAPAVDKCELVPDGITQTHDMYTCECMRDCKTTFCAFDMSMGKPTCSCGVQEASQSI